jgi:hypothetical protein
MSEFLFKIQDTFQFENIGLVVGADIKIKDAKLKTGDEIELRTAKDSSLITRVEGIPMENPSDPDGRFSFLLPKSINKEVVPIGTEVWSHP